MTDTAKRKKRQSRRHHWLMGAGIGTWVTMNKYTRERVSKLFMSKVLREATQDEIESARRTYGN